MLVVELLSVQESKLIDYVHSVRTLVRYLLYGRRMDPEIVESVRRANEAAITLLTLMINDENEEAADLAIDDPSYRDPATMMALATVCTSALKTLALAFDTTPQEVIQVAGLSAAQRHIEMLNDEGE